jgi:hypothetical protein
VDAIRHFKITMTKRETVWARVWRRLHRRPVPVVTRWEFDGYIGGDQPFEAISTTLGLDVTVTSPVVFTDDPSPYPVWLVRLSRGHLV